MAEDAEPFQSPSVVLGFISSCFSVPKFHFLESCEILQPLWVSFVVEKCPTVTLASETTFVSFAH